MFQGAGHNDVELYNQYLERLKTFVAHELTNASKHLEEEANNETDDCYKTGLEDLRPADTELGEDGQLVVPEQDREENGDEEEEWS